MQFSALSVNKVKKKKKNETRAVMPALAHVPASVMKIRCSIRKVSF